MKAGIKWTLFVVFGYLIFLVIKLPAVQALNLVTLPKGVAISQVSGTVWQGRAQSVLLKGTLLNNVKWDLSFFSLLLGKANANITAGSLRDKQAYYVKGQIGLGLLNKSFQAQDMTIYYPAQAAFGALPLPVPIEAIGRFKVNVDALEYQEHCIELIGKGQWQNAQVNLKGNVPLGTFDALLSCKEQKIAVDIKGKNKFSLQANVLIDNRFNYNVNGRYKPAQDLPQEMQQAASFFGSADSQGYYTIDF